MSTNENAPQVLIVVEGGVVQYVLSNRAVEVLIKDFDDIEADPAQFDPEGFQRPRILNAVGFKAAIIADTHFTEN